VVEGVWTVSYESIVQGCCKLFFGEAHCVCDAGIYCLFTAWYGIGIAQDWTVSRRGLFGGEGGWSDNVVNALTVHRYVHSHTKIFTKEGLLIVFGAVTSQRVYSLSLRLFRHGGFLMTGGLPRCWISA